jgi:hypothetical protein
MTSGDLFLEILTKVDGFAALAVALWVLIQGMRRFDTMQDSSNERIDTILQRHESFTKQVLEASAARNDQLMSLVSTLCAQQQNPSSRAASAAKN